MISRTIETVEVAGKTLFYEIRIEDIEFHILGQTVKTNKWLRFEEWQQIYEQVSKSLSTYSTPPDFTIKSFTVGNYIRVEIELFPIETCYGDLFKVKLENCLPDFLQIRIRQIALGSSLEEIQQAERNHEEITAAIAKRDKRDIRKNKKKRRSASLSEYNPVAVKRNVKSKYVPPYKPSKLSPEIKEFDEPYSPKPVNVSEDDGVANYTPYTVSATEKKSGTPPIVPTYKPSAIVKKNCEDFPVNFTSQNQAQLDEESFEATTIHTSVVSTGSEEMINSTSPSPTFESTEKNIKSETCDKQIPATRSYRCKRAKLSQDLFADSERDSTKDNELAPSDGLRSATGKSSKRKKWDDSDEMNSEQTMGSPSLAPENKSDFTSARKDSAKILVVERRSSRKPAKKIREDFETCVSRSTRESIKPSNRALDVSEGKKLKLKEKRDMKNKKELMLKKDLPSDSQESGSIKQDELSSRKFAMPSKEELQQNNIKYEREIEILENFSKDLKKIIKPPPKVDLLDLNDMKVNELIATFKDFKCKLDRLFEKYKGQKRFQCKPEAEKLYLLVLNIIDRNRVISMMDHLQSIYEPDCDGIPTYTDLFMNLMAPEWVLRIFMQKYNYSREQAIERIQLQRDAEAFNQSRICT